MAAEISKPDFSYQWSSGGAIVAPSNVKIQTGWTAEVPPFQWENFLQNRQDNAILHLFQKGISEWDALSNYYFTTSGVRSYVQGSDGIIYAAVSDSIGQDPTTDLTDTYWKVAFADNSTALTTTTGDARYAQRANNLSDLANTATALSNLGGAPLASPSLTGVPTAPTAALDTSTTQLATTAFLFQQFTGTGKQGLTLSGHQVLPGDLIIQWGQTNVTAGIVAGVTFPVTFPNAFFSGGILTGQPTGNNTATLTQGIQSVPTTTGMNLINSSGTVIVRWMVVGF